MPRPLASPKQHGRAYDLYRGDLGPSAIFDKLCEEFEEPVSARTVSNWMRGFRDLDKTVVALDSPFEWHRMEEYGLPWEASRWLLEVWGVVIRGRTERPFPTLREARWWWRIHQAVPRIQTDTPEPEWLKELAPEGVPWVYFDTVAMARAFVARELAHELLGEPMVMDDLEALIALRPWENRVLEESYRREVDLGTIPPVRPNPLKIPIPPGLTGEGTIRVFLNSSLNIWPDQTYPHKLPHQLLDL